MKDILTGASVLIFEKDCILLFREIQGGSSCCYTEPGGKYEYKHDNIEHAANDELYEETCCLFDSESPVSKLKKNNYFDLVYSKDKKSRVFMIKVPYLKDLREDYFSNLSILKKGRASKHFLETNDVTRVYIDDLRNAVLTAKRMGDVYVKDAYGKKIKLKKRTANILFVLFTEMDIASGVKIKKINKIYIETDDDGLTHYIF